MSGRFGIAEGDRRNLVVVAVAVGLVMAVLTEGPILTRVVVAVVAGMISAASFLLVTVVLNAVKPDHW